MAVTLIQDSPKAQRQERLIKFCEGLANGLSRRDAYVAAGYLEGSNVDNISARYYKQNLEFIKGYFSEHIVQHAPTAFNVLLEIMNDPSEKGGIRLKAAQDVLDRAGYGAKQKLEITTKAINEMDTGELEDEIKRIVQESPELVKLLLNQGPTGLDPSEEEGGFGS